MRYSTCSISGRVGGSRLSTRKAAGVLDRLLDNYGPPRADVPIFANALRIMHDWVG